VIMDCVSNANLDSKSQMREDVRSSQATRNPTLATRNPTLATRNPTFITRNPTVATHNPTRLPSVRTRGSWSAENSPNLYLCGGIKCFGTAAQFSETRANSDKLFFCQAMGSYREHLVSLKNVRAPIHFTSYDTCYQCRIKKVTLDYDCATKKYSFSFKFVIKEVYDRAMYCDYAELAGAADYDAKARNVLKPGENIWWYNYNTGQRIKSCCGNQLCPNV
jgi:hypothetical protein